MRTTQTLFNFLKNIVLMGGLFIILSIVVDWYRKPTAPIEFSQQVLYDTQAQPKVLAQMSYDKPMLLYFWGSWCSFCKYTSPSIQQLAKEGVPVLAVALKSGSVEDVNHYLAQENYDFTTINDPTGAFSKEWDIQATPTILIIKDGKIINHTTGLTSLWGLKIRLWLADIMG